MTLDVEAKPLPIGDRTVAITVRTDSAATPIVPLQLRMIGSNKPPFMLDATGELVFLNVERSNLVHDGEHRQCVVRMIESKSDAREPTSRVDPPALVVEKVSSTTQPYVTPESVVRMHTYRVSFAGSPIEDRPAGTIRGVDPWFPAHQTELRIMTEIRSRIRATPSRLDLASAGREASAEFLTLTDGADPMAIDQDHAEAESPLRVEPIGAKGGVARFRVSSPAATGPADLTRRMTIRAESIADEVATVSGTIRRSQP